MATDYTAAVQELYVAYFSRPADTGGLLFWNEALNAGRATIADIAAEFAKSTEYQATYGGKTAYDVVAAVYQNLFSRAPEVDGLNFWAQHLMKGDFTVAYAVQTIAAGAQGDDLTAFKNKVTAAAAFTNNLDTSSEILGYSGDAANASAKAWLATVTTDASLAAAIAPAAIATAIGTVVNNHPGQSVVLTTGVDTVTGTAGADTFNAAAVYDSSLKNTLNTLSSLDVIDGGAGKDVLNVVDDVLAISVPTTASVKNVEVANFRSSLGVTANVAGWTGLTDANVTQAGGAVSVTAAEGTNVTIGKVTGAGGVTVTGASTVSMTDVTKGGAIKVVANGVTTAATIVGGTTVDIDDDGAGADATTVKTVSVTSATGNIGIHSEAVSTVSLAKLSTTGQDVTIDNANANGHTLALNLNKVGYTSKGAALADNTDVTDATATEITVTTSGGKSSIGLAADKATALTVGGDQALNLDFTQAKAALTTLKVTGSAGLTSDLQAVTTLATVDLSGTSGANKLTLANVAKLAVTGGSGADTITTVGAIDAKTVIALGAGNDVYHFDTAATAGATVSGGEGSDTIAVIDGALLDAASAKVYSGFETLEIAKGTGAYDVSLLGLTSVTLTGDVLTGAADITKAAANTSVTLDSAGAGNLTTGSALSFALKDASGTADNVTLSLVATDSVEDNGTADGQWTVTKFEVKDDANGKGVESVTISSNVTAPDVDNPDTVAANESLTAADYVNTVTDLTAAKATTVKIVGDASLTIDTITGAAVSKIDATAAHGAVTITNAVAGVTSGVTYLGGSGVDTYTASGNGDLLVGNAGADAFTLAAGKDTVRYAKATDSVLSIVDTNKDGTVDTIAGIDTITAFVSATDKIELSSALGLATGDARLAIAAKAAAAGTTAADLKAAIGTGVDFFDDGAVDRAIATISDGTDLYVFADVNHDGNFTAGSDLVIKLAGVTTVLISDFVFG